MTALGEEGMQKQKQNILNDLVDRLMQLKHKRDMQVQKGCVFDIKKTQINFMQMFDLLIWTEKKKPQILLDILQMDVLSLAITIIPDGQMFSEVKAFILLINNCKVNGQIIIYLLANSLVDLIIVKYLKSISSNKLKNNNDLDEQLQYLGSLLKACSNHLNQKTYTYFLNKKISFEGEMSKKQITEGDICSKVEGDMCSKVEGNVCDPFDIFNTCDESIEGPKSIQGQYKQCLLVKVCTRFYNCPQQLTKTTVMNILMSILRRPFASQLIMDRRTNKLYPYMSEWSRNLCCQFRNQLKNYNQQLKVLKAEQQNLLIQQINDKIILWQDLTQTQFRGIYRQNLMHLVIYSLVVGSLNMLSLPMFNIKFTFFILAKMMRIFSNLDLLNDVGGLLFIKSTIRYSENWVSTAVLKCFDIDKILDDNQYLVDNIEEEQINSFSDTNQFFFNMLKSKDQHFLQISSNMLQQMLLHVRNNQKSIQFFNLTLGFGQNGANLVSISSVLISQLKFDHSLKNLKRLCDTLLFIHPSKVFSDQNLNQFVYFYAEQLSQTLELIQKGHKHWNYLIQTFQYDMKILQFVKFTPKVLKDKQLLIHPSENVQANSELEIKQSLLIHENEYKKSFHNLIPETPSQILRYRVVKTFLLLKFKEQIMQIKTNDNILKRYVQKLRIWEQKQLKPGDKIAYPLKSKFYQCKVIEQKTQIPCVVIDDDVNLIIGFVQSNHVKIIVNAKIKHIESQIYTKKDKTYIRLTIFKFDFMTENIVHKSTLILRGFQTGIQYIAVKKQNFKQKQLSSIKKGLKKSVQSLPLISLL